MSVASFAALLFAVTCCQSPAARHFAAANALTNANLSMGRTLGRVYVRSNRSALKNDAMRTENSEPCKRVDGRISRRPTVASDPPFPAKALGQRIALGNVLQAYESAAVATAERNDDSAGSAATTFLRAAKTFSRAANRHAQADLFVEDDAAKFLGAAYAFSTARRRDDRVAVIVRTNAEFRKLETILVSDFRAPSRAAGTPAASTGGMSFCSEPRDLGNVGVSQSGTLIAALVAIDDETEGTLKGAPDDGALTSRIDDWKKALLAVDNSVR